MSHDILIVDDEADIRMLMSGVLRDEGYQTRDAADSDSALVAIQAPEPASCTLPWASFSRFPLSASAQVFPPGWLAPSLTAIRQRPCFL